MTFTVPDAPQEPIGLQWVGFETKCATPDLAEGGGSVAMTRAAIKYVFGRWPQRDRMQLTDDSKLKRCKAGLHPRYHSGGSDLRDIVVPLAYHSLMLHGATWYQRHMAAELIAQDEPARIRRLQVLQEVRDRLATRLPQTPGAFEAWMAEFVVPATISPSFAWMRGSDVTSAMRGAYEASGSWFEFYRNVNARCGCGVFAILVDTVLRNPPSEGGMGLNMNTWTWEIRRQAAAGGAARARGGGRGCYKMGNAASARAYFRRLDLKSKSKSKSSRSRAGCLEFP
jgi:hypothetical protein